MSLKTYDVESLLSDIKAVMVANLNTKIAAIEAEKIADGFPNTGLLPVDTSLGYFQQSWSDNILNIDPAIFFGIIEIKSEGMGPLTRREYNLFAEVVLVDSGMDRYADIRINRYSRALQEVFETYFSSATGTGNVKIESVTPVAFKVDQNSSEVIKVGGVTLTIAIA